MGSPGGARDYSKSSRFSPGSSGRDPPGSDPMTGPQDDDLTLTPLQTNVLRKVLHSYPLSGSETDLLRQVLQRHSAHAQTAKMEAKWRDRGSTWYGISGPYGDSPYTIEHLAGARQVLTALVQAGVADLDTWTVTRCTAAGCEPLELPRCQGCGLIAANWVTISRKRWPWSRWASQPEQALCWGCSP